MFLDIFWISYYFKVVVETTWNMNAYLNDKHITLEQIVWWVCNGACTIHVLRLCLFLPHADRSWLQHCNTVPQWIEMFFKATFSFLCLLTHSSYSFMNLKAMNYEEVWLSLFIFMYCICKQQHSFSWKKSGLGNSRFMKSSDDHIIDDLKNNNCITY